MTSPTFYQKKAEEFLEAKCYEMAARCYVKAAQSANGHAMTARHHESAIRIALDYARYVWGPAVEYGDSRHKSACSQFDCHAPN